MKKNIRSGVNNSLPPYQIEDDPYVEVYNELRKILVLFGMQFPHKKRLDTFHIYQIIWQMEPTELTHTALYLINELTIMKTMGYEPGHKNGYYL